MSLRYTITAYCSDCGIDFLESDSDDLDELVAKVEVNADQYHIDHVKKDLCS